MTGPWDDTWRRLRDWVDGSVRAERLAAQIILGAGAGYQNIDPSHPLGGPDQAHDATVMKDGDKWIMAVYFPPSRVTFGKVRKKVRDDAKGVSAHGARGLAFVTNQPLTVTNRRELERMLLPHILDVFHLERIGTILNTPAMHSVREQFLGVPAPGRTTGMLSLHIHAPGGAGGNSVFGGAGGGGGSFGGSGGSGGHR